MKKLLLLIFFSGSLSAFSQVEIKTLPGTGDIAQPLWRLPLAPPDTLRATLIVYYDKGPAILHTKPGFVVRQLGKEEVYLDVDMKVVKSPLEVLTYKIKK